MNTKKEFHTARVFTAMAILLFAVFGTHAQNIDSLENIIKTGTTAEQMEALNQLITLYEYNNTPKALEYVSIEKKLADKEKQRFYQGNVMAHLGAIYYSKKMIDSALYYYQGASAIWEELNDSLNLAIAWSHIGSMQTLLNRPVEAIENNRKALAYFQRVKRADNEADALNNIANAYGKMDNIQKSNEYTLKAIKIQEEVKDTIGLGISYYNLGTKNNSIEYGEKAIVLFRQAKNLYRLGMSLVRVCRIILNNNTSELTLPKWKSKIIRYLDEASDIAEKTNNNNMKYEILSVKTQYELIAGNFQKAQSLAENLLATTDTTMTTDMLTAYQLLLYSSIRTNDQNNAIIYFEKYCRLIEEMHQKEWVDKMSEMEIKFETEKKELQITALQKQKELIMWLSIAGGGVLLLILTVSLFLWRLTVQRRRFAEQHVTQLEQEKRLVATQSVLDGETHERSRLARDLHDGLGSMLTGVKLNLMEMKKGAFLEYVDVERFNRALELLDESVQEMRRVAHHLMPDSLARFGLKPAVSDFCSNFPQVKFAYFGDDSRLDPNLEVMIYRTIHELVNNALKHSHATEIFLQIMQEPDRIAFTVQDNGCGFNSEAKTDGTGLQNIRDRVTAFNGIISIDSKIGQGTEINVELMINNK